MFETVKINRLIQFVYPTLILATALLTWILAGHVTGSSVSRIPLLNREPTGNVRGTGWLSCSTGESAGPNQLSCGVNSDFQIERRKL